MNRVPSTPELATLNVQLEAEFHEQCTALRVDHNQRLNELRKRRQQVKYNFHAHVQAINHAWAVERANIRAAIDRLVDERAHLRAQIHDGFSTDEEAVRQLTEQIHEQRIKLANEEMACNARITDAREALNDAVAELGKESITLHEEYHRRKVELRQQLQKKVGENREKAFVFYGMQKGGEL